MTDEKAKEPVITEAKAESKKADPKGKVFNFTREGVVIEAKNRKEAEKALKDKLKEDEKENK